MLEYLGLTRSDWPPQRRAVLWSWVAWAIGLSLARALGAVRAPRAGSPCERLWFWFRDHWGVVWALRVVERFNRSAELARWPVRLTWFGLTPVAPSAAETTSPDEAEVEATFRGLIRRFAQPWRLDEAAQPPASCPQPLP